MRQQFYAVILLVCACAFSQAQETGFAFGPAMKAGISQIIYNRSDTVNLFDVKSKVKFSYQAGAFLAYRFTNSFAIGTEVNYWKQNGSLQNEVTVNDTLNDISTTESTRNAIHLSYVAIPLYVMFYLRNASILLGAQAGYSISQNSKQTISTTINGVAQDDVVTNSDPQFMSYDYGGKAGIHYQISHRVDAGIEYYLGRTNLTNGTSEKYNAHNQNFYAALRYNIITNTSKDKVNGFYRN